MSPLLIIVGLFLVYEALKNQRVNAAQNQQAEIATNNPASISLSATISRNQNIAAQRLMQKIGSGANAFGVQQGVQVGVSVGAAGVGVAAAVGAVSGTVAAVTAGIGAALIPVFMLWSAHTARLRGATNENTAINQAVPAFDADMYAINGAYNSGQISAPDAIAALNQVSDNYWAYMSKQLGQPGVAGHPCGTTIAQWKRAADGAIYPVTSPAIGTLCNSGCTAGCCVGCNDINNGIAAAIYVLQHGGHDKSSVPQVYPSKYGATARPGYTLTWN